MIEPLTKSTSISDPVLFISSSPSSIGLSFAAALVEYFILELSEERECFGMLLATLAQTFKMVDPGRLLKYKVFALDSERTSFRTKN